MTATESVRRSRVNTLRYLADHGPANKYKIQNPPKDNGKIASNVGSQPTFLEAFKLLEDNSLVYVKYEKPSERGKRDPSKYYELTKDGIVYLITQLTACEADIRLLNRMKGKYSPDLPQLFEFWSIVVQAGLEELGFKRLQSFLASYLEYKDGKLSPFLPDGMIFSRLDGIEQGLTRALRLLFNPYSFEEADRKKLLEAVRRNEKFREIATTSILESGRLLLGIVNESTAMLGERTALTITTPEQEKLIQQLHEDLEELKAWRTAGRKIYDRALARGEIREEP